MLSTSSTASALRSKVQRPSVVVFRLLPHREPVIGQVAHADVGVGLDLVVARELDELRERLGELVPLLGRFVEVAELPPRLRVARVERSNLLVVRNRVFGMSEVLPVPLGTAETDRDLSLRLLPLLQHLVGRAQKLVPLVVGRRDPFEVERRVLVREVLAPSDVERVVRLLAVVEMLLVDPGRSAQELDAFVAILRRFDTRHVKVDQVVPALRFLVERLQLGERILVHRVDIEDPAESARSAILVAYFALPELGDRNELTNRFLRIDERLRPLLHDTDRSFPVALIAVDQLERVQRFEERRVDRQNGAIGLDCIARLL